MNVFIFIFTNQTDQKLTVEPAVKLRHGDTKKNRWYLKSRARDFQLCSFHKHRPLISFEFVAPQSYFMLNAHDYHGNRTNICIIKYDL